MTINTDDLGIFHTTIDNEYCLLVMAALKEKDEQGQLKHSQHEVMSWIKEIRGNGFIYAFGES